GRNDDLAAQRDAPARESRAPAARDHRDIVLVAPGEHPRPLILPARPTDRPRLPPGALVLRGVVQILPSRPFDQRPRRADRAQPTLDRRAHSPAATTGFRTEPSPSIDHTPTPAPGCKERGGSMNSPQPHGVPVSSTSPGSRVKLRLQKVSNSATPN